MKERFLDALIRGGDLDFAADLAHMWANRKGAERIEQLRRKHPSE